MGYSLLNLAAFAIIFLGMLNILRIVIFMIGSDFYNLREHILRVRGKARKIFPTISVLIPAHNEANTIASCLRSVVRAKYPRSKLQIIVVDDGSTDATVDLVHSYVRRYGVKNVLVLSQANQGKAHALNNALKNYATGDLVMCLDADSSIDRMALKEAAWYFRDTRVVALAANVRIRPQNTVLNFTQRLEYLISYQFKRALTYFNIEYIIGGIGSVFRRKVMAEVGYYDTNTLTEDIDLTMKFIRLGNKNNRVIYGPRVIAHTESVLDIKGLVKQRYRWKYGRTQTFFKNLGMFFNLERKHSKLLTFVHLPYVVFTDIVYFFEPLLVAYLIGASIYYQDLTTLLSAFIVMSVYVVMNVLAESTMSIWERIKLAMVAPIMYLLFYIINFIDYIALFKSVWNLKGIWKSVQAGSVEVCGWEHVARSKA